MGVENERAGRFKKGLKKVQKKPETNGRLASFLLLPSHRAYGILGMGIP